MLTAERHGRFLWFSLRCGVCGEEIRTLQDGLATETPDGWQLRHRHDISPGCDVPGQAGRGTWVPLTGVWQALAAKYGK